MDRPTAPGIIKPTYTITDKDLVELESWARDALTELSKYAPVDVNNRKVPVPGIRSTQKILSMCQSLRDSQAGNQPVPPEVELEKLQRDLAINLEWMESHRLDPKTNAKAKESVREGIKRIEARIAVLNQQLGALEPVATATASF